MRKIAFLALGIAAVLSIAILSTPSATAAIDGSAHDFETATWNSGDQICAPCHTPHGGSLTVTDAPLWSHTLTTATYTTYTSDTINATMGAPTGVSKLCLSCHDGSVAYDSFYGVGTPNATVATGSALIGLNLNAHHPVSFTYDDTLASTDGELHAPTTTSSGITGGGNIDDDLLFGAGSDQLECASCHDVHNSAAVGSLLVKSNTGSALCLTCHIK